MDHRISSRSSSTTRKVSEAFSPSGRVASTRRCKSSHGSTLSALVWTTLITYLGYLVGDNWTVVEEYLRTYGLIISGILLLVIGYKLLRFGLRWRQRARARKEPVKKPEPPDADAPVG